MTQFYIFNQPGSIPGVPGMFANCTVEIAEDGTLTQTPLALAPHLVEAEQEDSHATDPELPAIQVEQPVQQAEEEAPIQEQEAPATPTPSSNGG